MSMKEQAPKKQEPGKSCGCGKQQEAKPERNSKQKPASGGCNPKR